MIIPAFFSTLYSKLAILTLMIRERTKHVVKLLFTFLLFNNKKITTR